MKARTQTKVLPQAKLKGIGTLTAEAVLEPIEPPTRIDEKKDKYIVNVLLDGRPKGEINLRTEGDILEISGEYTVLNEQPAYSPIEEIPLKFATFINLQHEVDIETAEKDYNDGSLVVTLLKLHGKGTTGAGAPVEPKGKGTTKVGAPLPKRGRLPSKKHVTQKKKK